MKRLWISLAIVFVMLSISGLGMWHLIRATDKMEVSLALISEAIAQKKIDQAQNLIDSFEDEWHKNEESMMRYIHHNDLDIITGAVSRLSALAEYEELGELSAEVQRIRNALYHLRESEIPTFKSIL
ncbi:DUF4363 family protein [Oscillospiraceae bacterium PP1C4]